MPRFKVVENRKRKDLKAEEARKIKSERLEIKEKWHNITPKRPGSATTACGTPFLPGVSYVEVNPRYMGVNTPGFMDNVNRLFSEIEAERQKKRKQGVPKRQHPDFKQAAPIIVKDRIIARIRCAFSLAVNWTEEELKLARNVSKPCPKVGKEYEEWVKMVDAFHKKYKCLSSNRDVVVYSSDGIAIFYLFRNGMDMHLKNKERPVSLKDHLYTSLARRNIVHTPGKPPSGDNRHYNWDATSKACEAAKPKQACGVHHYGCWSPVGHTHVIPTSDTLSHNIKATDHVTEMYKDLAPMFGGMGLVFSVVDPVQYRLYRAAFKEYVENLARRQMQVPVDNMAWLTWAHVVNLRVLPHKDKQDAANGWVGMTPLGEFKGGDLVLPDFHLRFQYRPGDLCLFRSAIIEHAVAPFTGDRTAIVLFTHENDLKLGNETMDPKIRAAWDGLKPLEDVPTED